MFIQNQTGAGELAKRWDRTGTVVEDKNQDKYAVKVDGSGRLTDRNRRYLILRPLSQPPGCCPHHPSLLTYMVRKMMLQDNQPGLNSSLNLELCNMMVRDTLSHTPLLTGLCRASVHHSRRSLKL